MSEHVTVKVKALSRAETLLNMQHGLVRVDIILGEDGAEASGLSSTLSRSGGGL